MPRFRQTVPSALAALLALAQCTAADSPPGDSQARPSVQLMTSLPLVWGDGASMESILSGDSEPAPIYRYWQNQYEMLAVDSLEDLASENPDIVLLAQPRAMAPADLADLDAWVRTGGAVIILTDPDLAWPSELPLGDPRRPLITGLLSPLLEHWGLELVALGESRAGAAKLRVGKYSFTSRGIGKLEPLASNVSPAARCDIEEAGFVAHCSIGEGRATVVADADLLDAALWPDQARRSPAKSGAVRFVDSLVREQISRTSRKP
ncbi:MAG: hypothetical protein GW808_06950 [Sphingomonadales bacterium]|nr:hypothetical protein [Sphingomonadales bacterium]NCO47795.1 hypothetical protein [Sphingomonadales bacterium]NCP01099.1 hypothetical protein [Sphingomonadales bacterium]NCP27500.1 hypothetical protein [Sphingomonadales bacterium]NCP43321.1 hypothetical protein [Sphingomonadales bacterium]